MLANDQLMYDEIYKFLIKEDYMSRYLLWKAQTFYTSIEYYFQKEWTSFVI